MDVAVFAPFFDVALAGHRAALLPVSDDALALSVQMQMSILTTIAAERLGADAVRDMLDDIGLDLTEAALAARRLAS